MGNLRAVQLPDGGRLVYRVDGLNRRVEKLVYDAVDALVRWERYTYKDQLEPVAMQVLNPANGSTTSVLYFVYGTTPHVPAYMVDDLGNHFAFVTDQVGSVRKVVEVSTGAVVHSMRYTAFGEVLDDDFAGAWPPQPFGYAGGLYDRETGFVRFGARDYDAFTRRWTAKDPIRFEGGDTNLFAYVGNNPVESVDPTGLQASPQSRIPSPATPAGEALFGLIEAEAGEVVVRSACATAVAAAAAAATATQAEPVSPWPWLDEWLRARDRAREEAETDVVPLTPMDRHSMCREQYELCDDSNLNWENFPMSSWWQTCYDCYNQCKPTGIWPARAPDGRVCI